MSRRRTEMSRGTVSIRTYAVAHPFLRAPDSLVETMDGAREARDVSKGDWLLLPSPGASTLTPTAVDALLGPEPPPLRKQEDTSRLTGERLPVTREQLAAHLDDGMTYAEIATLYGKSNKSVPHRWAMFYGLNKPGGNVIERGCVHDPDFWRVAGMWIAEGSFTQGRKGPNKRVVRWTFSWDEWDTHAQFVVDTLKRYDLAANKRQVKNYHGPHTFPSDRDWSCTTVSASSAQLAGLFLEFGAGAHHKRLPSWAFRLPKAYALALVQGWTDGDGYFWKQNGGYRVASSSFDLLYGMQRLLARHGQMSQVMTVRADAGELRWGQGGHPYSTKCDERGLWVRVKKVETVQTSEQRDLFDSGGSDYSVEHLLAA